jgi:2-polyprenyl-6-hydroxyphenyl methylase/3-demethylubiquinone-9 3-methyltransferase
MMDRLRLPPLSGLVARYVRHRGVPLRDRLHVAVRVALCPFRRLSGLVPPAGLIVDLGCGHGHFCLALAEAAPERRVVGVDPAMHKLSVAATVAGRAPNVYFVGGSALSNPVPGPCQAVLLVDILYLLSRAQQEQVLRDCYDRLAPGGTLLLKTMDARPRWKAALNRIEEWLAVRVLCITLGGEEAFSFRPLSEWAALCEEIGFETSTLSLDRGYYHPHGAIVGVRR